MKTHTGMGIVALLLVMAFSSSTFGESLHEALSGESTDENQTLQEEAIGKLDPEIRAKIVSHIMSSSSTSEQDQDEIVHSLKDGEITVLSYRKEVVSGGTAYFVKAKLGKSAFVFHLGILEDFQGSYSLHGVKGPFKQSDPIEAF